MRRTDLLGARETRTLPTVWESRATSADELTLTGYASVFDSPYDIYGGAASGGWSETVDPKAFNVTLRGKPDVHLLINHEGMPLARTKSGTLKLSTDSTGLAVEAKLDRGDPDVQRLERKMVRGDMDEMSFAFRTIRDQWEDVELADGTVADMGARRLLEVSIDKGDVSVVNFGANPATSSELQRALRSLAAGDAEMLAEVRGLDVDLAAVRRALAQEGKASKTSVARYVALQSVSAADAMKTLG